MIQKDYVVDVRPPHSCSTQSQSVPLCCIDANGGPITDNTCDDACSSGLCIFKVIVCFL